ncbi:hypothetical protein HYALB_00000672 [Hymenoscyphus albidus]|uniref:2EXR domain-containing protein n=1 Tax=Hymenoscyphus albidus TaxID=595503 RepID=A0A9N9LQJ1_9HELO|nr:hypothetical protein HYALB_00000672 [Hymenoscyphus albidus]
MANRIPQHPSVTDSFHQFSKLVDEVRLMIWEFTWPTSRVIEAALFNNPEGQEEESIEPFEIVNLRLAGSLSTMLRQEIGCRVVEEGPMEQCPDPVALRICHQSRMHTLKRYRLMPSLARPFYYHPRRDILLLTVDVADDYPMHMPVLQRYHGTELNYLETILVSDGAWPETEAEKRLQMRYALDYISHLGGLQTIQVLLGSEESRDLDGEGKEVGLLAHAERLRSNFPAIIENERCTAKNIQLMDSNGKVY